MIQISVNILCDKCLRDRRRGRTEDVENKMSTL